MKPPLHINHRTSLQTPARRIGRLAALAFMTATLAACAAVYNVNVGPFTLYDDPNTENEIKLGGLSGLFPVPGDTTGTLFYTVTDRGPISDHPDVDTHPDLGNFKIFPIPTFSPRIVKLQLLPNGTAEVLEIIPLQKPGGAPLTGRPNPCLVDTEDPYDLFLNPVPLDSDGLDVEGLTMDAAGNFWVSEEYRPSISMVAPDGTVQFRLVPAGTVCGDEVIPTYDILPAVYTKRRANRGMEGIAFSKTGFIYGIMQRPLKNPNAATGNSSRNIRILELNLEKLSAGDTAGAIRQYLYVTEANASQASVYAADLFSLSPALLLVPERRTDKAFVVNIARASDITPLEAADGTLLADPTRTIEQLAPDELAAFGIRPVTKAVVVPKLTALDPALAKSEGACVVGRTLVLVFDNDFNLREPGVDISTTPASILLQNPPLLPRVITTPLPEEIVLPE